MKIGIPVLGASLVAQGSPVQETWVRSLGREDPLEREMATYSSILAWGIPRTEKPGGLQSMKSQEIGYDLATKQQHILEHLSHGRLYICRVDINIEGLCILGIKM